MLKFPKHRRMFHEKCPKLAHFLNELADRVSTVVRLVPGIILNLQEMWFVNCGKQHTNRELGLIPHESEWLKPRFISYDIFGLICLLTLRGQFVRSNIGNTNTFLYYWLACDIKLHFVWVNPICFKYIKSRYITVGVWWWKNMFSMAILAHWESFSS